MEAERIATGGLAVRVVANIVHDCQWKIVLEVLVHIEQLGWGIAKNVFDLSGLHVVQNKVEWRVLFVDDVG